MILQAFADDSTHSLGDKRLYLAAYANSADNWIAFSDEWNTALREYPSIEYAKMTEAESLRGQFQGWDEKARDAKILRLARIIRKYKPWSIHSTVSTAECADILGSAVPVGFARPYLLCFQAIVVHLAQFHRRQGLTAPVDFIFDEQGGLGLEAVLMYDWLKESMVPEVRELMGATPIFRDDKMVAPLQAADLLAWHVRRWREGVDGPDVRPAFDLLVSPGRHVFVEIERPQLKRWASQIQRIPGTKELRHPSAWRAAKREIAAWIDAGHPPPNAALWRMRLRYARLRMRTLYQHLRRTWRILRRQRR